MSVYLSATLEVLAVMVLSVQSERFVDEEDVVGDGLQAAFSASRLRRATLELVVDFRLKRRQTHHISTGRRKVDFLPSNCIF